jgi:transposase
LDKQGFFQIPRKLGIWKKPCLSKTRVEIGTDMTKWKSAKHFSSWLAVCPGNKISGGKRLSGKTKPSKNRAREALGIAAQALTYSDSYLGAYYRRMRSKCGAPKANRAAAHKMGKIIYMMLKEGKEYKELGSSAYEELHKERTLRNIENRAKKLGYVLVAIAA